VGSSFLVSCASALGGDRALRLRIHCRESTWSFATHTTGATRIRSAIIPAADARPGAS
jgi:hypothetical protein